MNSPINRPPAIPEPTISEVNAIRMQGDSMDREKLLAIVHDDSLRDAFEATSANACFLIGLEIGMRVQAARGKDALNVTAGNPIIA